VIAIRIGVDLDNILNNLNSEWINTYNKLNNDSLTIEDIKSWDFHKYTKNGKEIYTYLNNDLFAKLRPLPHSIEATKNIMNHHELFVVTASYPNTIETKMNWLHEYFPHIPYDNVIICQRKDLVDVDLLIDDSPINKSGCSPNDTIIYTGYINSSVSYANILPNSTGCRWTIMFEDGSTTGLYLLLLYGRLPLRPDRQNHHGDAEPL
jgi:5'(3')-deoxyribonucleotidase